MDARTQVHCERPLSRFTQFRFTPSDMSCSLSTCPLGLNVERVSEDVLQSPFNQTIKSGCIEVPVYPSAWEYLSGVRSGTFNARFPH